MSRSDRDAAIVAATVPGDKSITHRALILAVLGSGESRIRNALVSLDTESTAACLRALGATVPALDPAGISLAGAGSRGLRPPPAPLDCGNSGTTARLLLGVLAGCPFRSVVTGDASLRSRPMRRVTEPLSRAGASFSELGEPDRLPVAAHGGPLEPIIHRSERASAQVKSALLLAGITGATAVHVSEPLQSRDHTERMLRGMGAPLRTRTEDDATFIDMERVTRLEPLDLTVPGDFSSAAFLLALAILGKNGIRIHAVGVNPTRTGFLDVLRMMGGRIDVIAAPQHGEEPVADVLALPSSLRATNVGRAAVVRMIDEVPLLAIAAARAEGETRITGASELRVKESDRLAALAANLRAIGAAADELPDGLVIRGTPAPLAGRIDSRGDHRIAMAFGVLAALPGNDIEVDDRDAAAVSFPGFWEMTQRLAGTRS